MLKSGIALQMKPAQKGLWLNKIALDGARRQARLHTSKLSILGVLRLQLVAVASQEDGVQLHWRCGFILRPFMAGHRNTLPECRGNGTSQLIGCMSDPTTDESVGRKEEALVSCGDCAQIFKGRRVRKVK